MFLTLTMDWTLWEDFTCLDVSQCMLNKTVLHVAKKYVESDISGCLGQLLALGTKASIWCGKHLKMTLMSTVESQEEHSSHFFLLVLTLLRFSASGLSALARSPVLGDKVLMVIVEKFIFEQLNLIKDSISEIKRIHSIASELLKVAQMVLDSAIRLCRAYSQALNWDSKTGEDEGYIDSEKADNVIHVTNITKCTIENLCELGVLAAAAGGGSLVTVLNMSWKGVVTLLQLGKGFLAVKVNAADIILTLISLANEPLRSAAEAWSSAVKEPIAITEVKRTFLPVKFYLINAVRISSQYPCQAFKVYKDITLCVLMISTFGISLSKEIHLKAASKVLVEVLEPTSFLLLHTLLNSAELKQESKFQILDWLFMDERNSNTKHSDEISNYPTISLDEIFCIKCEATLTARILVLGRVALFLNLLKSSPDLKEDTILVISRKLGWLLDILIDEEVYSSILVLHIPVLYGSGKTQELAWQPMFPSVLHALKTFMIVSSSSLAWEEVESFLLENFLHPHFLCWEIIMELWCFFMRHAEIEMVNDIIDKLCSLLKLLSSSEPAFTPSALRKMARSICRLLTCGTQSMIDRVYNSLISDDRSQLYVALLNEGFPLNLLSDNMKKIATQNILTAYYHFVENTDKEHRVDHSSRSSSSGVLGVPIYALSSALHCLQISASDIDTKTLKFTIAIIHGYRSAMESLMKDHYCKLLRETLWIISNMKHLYASDEIEEVILELQILFIGDSAASDKWLYQCKPGLALFMAALGHMEIAEVDGSAKSSAIWELYHLLLRERHWAFVHLAITAFGYFAARTSCNQLWRFVPPDAALSFNIDSGSESNEDRFMSELKAFLEKEVALLVVTPCTEQLQLLVKEGLMLKETVTKILNFGPEASGCESMEVDGEIQAKKRRKLPGGISEGMALLQSGLKVMGDGLVLWRQQHYDSTELQDKFSTHFSRLEDVIAHLTGLADSG
ncbi:hypothetical protein HHK36_027014 [Tetracentron sinense]|uniref:Uncharacterized protein n=1 Tax=Tetracentron sinense TaxID=13715 RepID=A0A835D2R4_TETSI|nr:hypothetical protein HHK36_027014 [Tetracentron sinense]